jgi:hypothetical protein
MAYRLTDYVIGFCWRNTQNSVFEVDSARVLRARNHSKLGRFSGVDARALSSPPIPSSGCYGPYISSSRTTGKRHEQTSGGSAGGAGTSKL